MISSFSKELTINKANLERVIKTFKKLGPTSVPKTPNVLFTDKKFAALSLSLDATNEIMILSLSDPWTFSHVKTNIELSSPSSLILENSLVTNLDGWANNKSSI